METSEILFALLRHVVCGEALKEETRNACTPEALESVYALAKKQDLAHLVAQAVERLSVPECEVLQKLKKARMGAIYRYVRMDHALEGICRILEAAQIPFVPLKGAVLRQYYPEPWMRTSGDIDLLVQEKDFERAVRELTGHGWMARGEIQYQNICLYSENGVLLELHFNIRVKMDGADAVMDSVWQHVVRQSGKQYTYHQTDAFFVCHHLAHMAKHVLAGGCGIRPFLDLWILEQRLLPREELEALCRDARLDRFLHQAALLAEVWFGTGQHTPATKTLETYLLKGGVYGSVSNKVVVSQVRTGGKLQNFLHRMFVPREEMARMYPVLKKRGWLTPVYQVVRWWQVLFDGRLLRAVKEITANRSTTEEQIHQAEALLKEMGLADREREEKR